LVFNIRKLNETLPTLVINPSIQPCDDEEIFIGPYTDIETLNKNTKIWSENQILLLHANVRSLSSMSQFQKFNVAKD